MARSGDEDSSDGEASSSPKRQRVMLRKSEGTSSDRAVGGPAGRILEWLGQSTRPNGKPKTKVRKAAHRTVKANSKSGSAGMKRFRRKKIAVNALSMGPEARGVSPCSARTFGSGTSPDSRGSPEASCDDRHSSTGSSGRGSERSKAASSSSSSPVRVHKQVPPRKRPRGPVKPVAQPLLVRAAAAAKKSFASSPSNVAALSRQPATQPHATKVDPAERERGFEAAIADKMRSLCGEHENAEVLAEFIVAMVDEGRGNNEMTAELKPFFQEQAESFVKWVDECKSKILLGKGSPSKNKAGSGRQAQPTNPTEAALTALRGKNAAVVDVLGGGAAAATPAIPIPLKSSGLPGRTANSRSTSASSTPVVSPASSPSFSPPLGTIAVLPGPHVAVTNRVVLQPNPDFAGNSAPATELREGAAAVAKPRVVPSRPPIANGKTNATLFQVAAATNFTVSKVNKNDLLENMTKQLQTILTKLSDKSLNDEMRERYQALAQNVQMQMAKISRPQAQRRRSH